MSTRAHCIDPAAVAARREELHVVDVRMPGEFESVHVPGARNIPLDELDGRVDELQALAEEREVALMCRSGNRAHMAQEQLAGAGLPGLPVVEGGIVAWEAAGLEVVRDRLVWDLERQVRFVAGLIVLVAVLASLVWPPARFVAGAVGAGLVFAAVTNTCGMAMLLARLPHNRGRAGAASPA